MTLTRVIIAVMTVRSIFWLRVAGSISCKQAMELIDCRRCDDDGQRGRADYGYLSAGYEAAQSPVWWGPARGSFSLSTGLRCPLAQIWA